MIHPMLQAAAALLSCLLYVAAAAWTGLRLFRPLPGDGSSARDKGRPLSTGLALMAGGAALHALVIAQTTWGGPGLNLAFFSALSLVAWLAVVALLIGNLRWQLEHLGLVLLPLAGVTVLLSLGGPTRATLPDSAWLETHIVVSMLAYSLLLAAAVQAAVLALVEYRLRHHRARGVILRLPALHTLEKQLFALVGLGFGLLTLAVGTGFLFLNEVLAGQMIHKTTLTLTAWVVFGGLLLGRNVYGWRGQTAVRWTLGGFAILVLGYFGTKAVLELILVG